MRIIAGEHRGRALIGPQDQKTTRPITDRVKEALFNRLHSLGMLAEGELHHVLDIFSGTGSLGLEALSRGAEHCTFIDNDRDALTRLKQNIETLGLMERSRIANTSALNPVWAAALPRDAVSLAFLDPPYALIEDALSRERVLVLLDTLLPKMEPAGVAVLRTPKAVPAFDRPGWDGPASFDYGSMTLHFYQRPMGEGDAPN